MRISRIRLAGFKSFVDPTTLNLPGNLTGVVGPNGCGKSNVIDAVLWVMGESSAKHLRGDSMADVIFNGSATRKPIGQAAVELIFDNSDGLIGGQYASYSEISIKRTVTRDGISSYYLNGVRCRRLDITNLFLGTGIGSRSYSVIEQGMISRIVEARPEELRLFLEEAAGISKYKARRKDTEHRIQNCRENLSRLDDIRLELDKQLNHLQQQAKAAERYQELKTEERHLQARMLALRWRDLLALEREAKHEAEVRATRVEAATAVLRATESQLAQARGAHGAAGDGFSTVQREYYSVGATIARLEQALQHVAELKLRQERDIDEARRGLAEARASESRDAAEIARLGGELAQSAPETERFAAAESTGASRLTQSEGEFHAWQGEWDAFQQRSADTTRRAEVSRTRLEHLEDSLSDLTERLAGLRDERVRLRAQIEGRRTEELRATVHAQRSRLEQLTGEQDGRQARLRDLRARAQDLARHLDAQRSEAHELRGRLASLEALQQAAFGADQPEVVDWLGRAGFASQPRLAQRITVEEGWEWPLEVVLGIPLDAVSVDVLEPFLDRLPQLRGGVVSAVETRQAVAAERKSRSVLDVPTLGERLGPDSGMDQLLATVYTVETLNDARILAPRLQPWESVVTRDGTWLGHGWVQVRHGRAAHEGILERERALRAHNAGLDALLQAINDREAGLRSVDDEIREVESALASAEPHVHEARERVTEESARLAAHIAEREQNERRLTVLEDDIHALEEQQATHSVEHQSISDEIETLANGADDLEDERERLVTRRDTLRDAVQAARESWREAREASHAVALRAESLRLSLHAGEQALARNRAIAAQTEERIAALAAALETGMAPQRQLRSDLDAALATQLRVEQDLVAARTELQGVEARIRELEQQRAAEDQEVLVQRESWESARVDLRAAEVRIADLKEQIAEHGLAEQALPADLPAEVTEASIHEEIERVARRVQRLGPINLAAIGEFAQLSERKSYLDAQHADLTAALTTLEEAIHKIDRETRTRFKETYDKVNAGLQGKFPLLFGGGHAYLELTGEDLLETGVTVMARPPGKRNGTIHLLSGGEKALTAVALIFAIFDLNPAPFCLLDEVDAPLDDANVVRLCELLKSMGDQIQFVFITHNKITMEIAGQLIGVTMQEPGVSRLVAVDMDEAVQLAATG